MIVPSHSVCTVEADDVIIFRPYDQQTYEDEIDEEDILDEEGRTRLRLKVRKVALYSGSFHA